MDYMISFFSLSTLFLQLVGATNDGASTISSYWNEVFPITPMPNAIRALLPSSPEISGFSRGLHHYDQVRPSPRGQAWVRRWGVLGHDYDQSKRNWSPNLAPLYFLRDDLQPGSKMNVTMMISPTIIDGSSGGTSIEPTFLPRQRAQAVPFSTSNLTTILEMFSIQPHSEHASLTRQTLEDCERLALKGEVKYCATSLESMIDFVVAKLGSSEIHAVVTSVEVVRFMQWSLQWPYMVPLIADDGSRVNALALCHFDTSKWNSGHASFRLLGVKPGTVPICQFIVKNHAWVPN
ncbi:BURP domain-containing protein 5-like [Nymphaea colorata]|nr:BURP domain-containing protein 5-like [Nymphaea colorata]